MNREKARELYSAYFEGTLEPGLRQSLDQRMAASAELREDYEFFVSSMRAIEALRDEEIEIPIYLSDRIATRLDQTMEKRKSLAPTWTLWVRNLAFGGLATAAILGTVISLNGRGGGGRNLGQAGVISNANVDQLLVETIGGQAFLTYVASENKVIRIRDAADQSLVKQVSVRPGESLRSEVKNSNPEPYAFLVDVAGDQDRFTLVVPGTARGGSDGKGTIRDLANVLAKKYGVSVAIRLKDESKPLEWKLEGTDARRVARNATQNLGFTVDQPSANLLSIRDR